MNYKQTHKYVNYFYFRNALIYSFQYFHDKPSSDNNATTFHSIATRSEFELKNDVIALFLHGHTNS